MWGIPQASDAQCEVSSFLPPYSESQLMDSSPHDRSKWRHGIPRRVSNEVHYQIPVRVGPIDGLAADPVGFALVANAAEISITNGSVCYCAEATESS